MSDNKENNQTQEHTGIVKTSFSMKDRDPSKADHINKDPDNYTHRSTEGLDFLVPESIRRSILRKGGNIGFRSIINDLDDFLDQPLEDIIASYISCISWEVIESVDRTSFTVDSDEAATLMMSSLTDAIIDTMDRIRGRPSTGHGF